MKICLGKEIEEVKKKDSEPEKNLLKSRNSEDINELDEDDVYFNSNTVKNIKLGTNTVNRIYLNNSIVYELEDTIDLNLFHSLVPKATATSITFDKIENQDVSNYNLIGYCDANNLIAVYQNSTEYLVLNIRNAVNYAPASCFEFLRNYDALTDCKFYNFDTKNTTNMQFMFAGCSNLTKLDLSNFNTTNVTTLHSCFAYCFALAELSITFSCINLTSLYETFYNCYKLEGTLDFSNCNFVNNISLQASFGVCYNLKTIILPYTLNRSSSMYWTFKDCRLLTTIIANSITSNSSDVFSNCTQLVGGNGTTYSSSHTNAVYARVDGENGLPGYFTAPAANNNK